MWDKEEQIAFASFLDGEIEEDFFGNKIPPPYPTGLPIYRAQGSILGADHGRIVQRRETHRYRHIRIETFYEDGFREWRLLVDPTRYKEGVVIVNGVYYDPMEYEIIGPDTCHEREYSEDQVSGPNAMTINHQARLDCGDNHSKKRRRSQVDASKPLDLNDLHPDLVGDFVIVEVDYEWPKPQKFPVRPLGPQLELFGGDTNGSDSEDGFASWLGGEDDDPLAGFLRGSDGD